MRLALCLLLFALLASGCDSSDSAEGSTLRAPGGRTPVAGAIEVRSPENVLLGTFGAGPVGSGYLGTLRPGTDGAPTGGGAVPGEFSFGPAYPNPTRGLSNIELSLPTASEVAVFVVAALPPGSPAQPASGIEHGSWVFRPGGLPVAIIHQGPVTAGRHAFQIDLRHAEGRPFPEGYYRVYAQTPYVLAWHDVLLDSDFFFTY